MFLINWWVAFCCTMQTTRAARCAFRHNALASPYVRPQPDRQHAASSSLHVGCFVAYILQSHGAAIRGSRCIVVVAHISSHLRPLQCGCLWPAPLHHMPVCTVCLPDCIILSIIVSADARVLAVARGTAAARSPFDRNPCTKARSQHSVHSPFEHKFPCVSAGYGASSTLWVWRRSPAKVSWIMAALN